MHQKQPAPKVALLSLEGEGGVFIRIINYENCGDISPCFGFIRRWPNKNQNGLDSLLVERILFWVFYAKVVLVLIVVQVRVENHCGLNDKKN
jgi:hypothetical protein